MTTLKKNDYLLGMLNDRVIDVSTKPGAVADPADMDTMASRLKKDRKQPKKQVSFYMSRDLEDRLTDLKRQTDLSMTSLIERLLEEVMGLR